MAVARRRISSGGGAPLRIFGGSTAATTRAPAAKDPYAESIKLFNNQLKEIQDAEAFKKLASGDDPEGFIEFAQKRLKEGDTGRDWAGLIKKAQNKIEETQWSDDLKSGRKTLEQFRDYLDGKLKDAPTGSSEAHDILKNIDGVAQAIKARDEAAKDQAALRSYIDSGDHKAYRDYLTGKLSRTTDPKLQSEIVKQIGEMDSRIAVSEQVDRAQQVSKITTDFKNHQISAGEAANRLQQIATAKGITAAEVNHIQTVTDSIFNEAAKRATGSGSGAPGATGSPENKQLNEERTTLEQAQANIREKLARNEPITQKDLDAVDTAAKAVQHISEAIAANPFTAASASRTAADEAKKASGIPMAIRGEVDDKTLRELGFDTKGNTQFASTLAATTDPAEKAKLLTQRAQDSQLALPKLLVPDTASIVNGLGGVAFQQARKAIEEITTKATNPTKPEQTELHNAYLRYAKTEGKNARSEDDWMAIIKGSPDAETAMRALGIDQGITDKNGKTAGELFKDAFDNTIKPLVNATLSKADYNVNKGFFGGTDPESVSAANTALELTRNLLHVRYGNDTEFSPSDVADFAKGGNPFSGNYDPTRDESMRARNIEQFGGGSKVMPEPAPITGDTAEPSDYPSAAFMGGQQMGGQAAFRKFGGDVMPGVDPNGNDYGFSGEPPSAQSPDARDRNAGFLSDQRSDLFSPQDPGNVAQQYLDAPTPLEFDSWSIPDLPTYDPVIPVRDTEPFDMGTTDNAPPLPDIPDVSGGSQDVAASDSGPSRME